MIYKYKIEANSQIQFYRSMYEKDDLPIGVEPSDNEKIKLIQMLISEGSIKVFNREKGSREYILQYGKHKKSLGKLFVHVYNLSYLVLARKLSITRVEKEEYNDR